MSKMLRQLLMAVLLLLVSCSLTIVVFAAKECPTCHRIFPDSDTVCPYDGSRLISVLAAPSKKRVSALEPRRSEASNHDSDHVADVAPPMSQEQKDQALLERAEANDLAGLKSMLSAGADLHAHTKDGTTVLMEAADHGAVSVAEYLLSHPVAVDEANRYGWTALMFAARRSNQDMVSLLKNHGASISLKDTSGETAVSIAESAGQSAIAAQMQSATDVPFVPSGSGNDQLSQNLLLAASMNRLDVFQHLLQQGASIESRTKDGTTALMHAADHGSLEVAKYILTSSRIDVNAQNEIGWTALMFASRRSNSDMATLLLDHAAKTEVTDTNGITPLMTAIRSNQPAIATLLISHGANVNAKDDWENTPVMLAAVAGEPDITASLIQANADLNTKNINGQTALYMARQNKHLDCAKEIRAAGGTE